MMNQYHIFRNPPKTYGMFIYSMKTDFYVCINLLFCRAVDGTLSSVEFVQAEGGRHLSESLNISIQ